MKTLKIIYWLSLVTFLILFYHQKIGLNLLIFNIIINICISIQFGFKQLNKETIILMIVSFITSCSSAWYADEFSIFMTIVLMILLPVFLFDDEKKLILAPIKLLLNAVLSIETIGVQSPFPTNFFQKRNFLRFLLLFLIPSFVFIVFVWLYSLANSNFSDLVNKVSFHEIDIYFFLLALLGGVLLFWFWYYRSAQILKHPNYKLEDEFSLETKQSTDTKKETLQLFKNSGIVLFVGLNMLIIFLLILDVNQLVFIKRIPNGFTHTSYLHQGVYAVITSIVFAIIVILIYFKNSLNFISNNQVLIYLAIIWVGLNLLLILTTSYKNILYIDAYGLTLKRLGVFAFLLLSVIGLGFTLLKVMKAKRNYYLYRNMIWTFLIFGCLICPMNWSSIITNWNLNEKRNHNIDVQYLYDLPNYNAHILLENQKLKPKTWESYNLLEQQVTEAYNERLDWRSTALYYDWFFRKTENQ